MSWAWTVSSTYYALLTEGGEPAVCYVVASVNGTWLAGYVLPGQPQVTCELGRVDGRRAAEGLCVLHAEKYFPRATAAPGPDIGLPPSLRARRLEPT